MEDFRELVDSLSLDESKRLLLGLAQDIFSILGEDEKKDFIMKMIGQTGYDKVGSMVQLWIAKCMDEGVDPQNMCSHLYGAMGILKSLSGHASSDLVFVFQEWLEEIEKECAEILNREPECSAGRMSEYLGLSEESARFVMRHVSSGINGDCRDDSKKTDNFKRSG